MPERPGVYSIDLRAGEISEDSALPTADDLLWGENDGAPTLISAARLLDSGGAALPVTAMAPTEPVDPETGARYAVSGNWGVFSPGQLVTKTATGWYVAAMRIGGLVARLDELGTVMQWTGSAWDEKALLDPDDLAALEGVDAALAAMAAAIAEFEALELPTDLDDIADSATRLAVTAEQSALLEGATASATADTLALRDENGRMQAVAGIDPNDVVIVSQLRGSASGTATTDLMRYEASASEDTELTADTPTVVGLDTEDFDRFSDLALSSNAILLGAGTYRAMLSAMFVTEGADLLQPVYKLRLAHNYSGIYVELDGRDVPQFPAPDADAGMQATPVTELVQFTLAGPASIRMQATSTEDATVLAGATLTLVQLLVPIAGGGGGGTSYGADGLIQTADGAGGFTSYPGFAIDRTNGIGRMSRVQGSCAVVAEPTWTGRAATLTAPSTVRQSYLTCSNVPQPVDGVGDVVLTVTAPTTFAGGVNGQYEEFELHVTNAHATNQMRVVMSGFTAAGAIARQLRLRPGDSGVLRYWRTQISSVAVWRCEGVPMLPDRIEIGWDGDAFVANARLIIMPRGTMYVPFWVNDQFFGYAPNGGPSATTIFQLQERVSGVWTSRVALTFQAANAYGSWQSVAGFTTTNFLGLLAPASLNGLTGITGGLNIGLITAG